LKDGYFVSAAFFKLHLLIIFLQLLPSTLKGEGPWVRVNTPDHRNIARKGWPCEIKAFLLRTGLGSFILL